MIALILKVLFWSVFATVVACIEIEAEGKHGWAERMPTWYRTTGFWGKAYGLIMGGKPLTGYHAFMFFFPVFVFHSHFVMGVAWTWTEECRAWAMYFGWCVLWDYHWFVLNPHYVGKFKKRFVWWHAKSPWVFGLFPVDYAVGMSVSVVLGFAAAILAAEPAVITDHMQFLSGCFLYNIALLLSRPAYHRWYKRMREHDDRDKAEIFHAE